MLLRTRLLALFTAVVLSACGGSDSPDAPPPQQPLPPVARVEIVPGAVLLQGAGDVRTLSAKAFAADGREVPAPVTWSSSRPASITVDAQGRATAVLPNGSAQITASSGGVQSPPILAISTVLPPGTVVVTDAQVVGDPVETDPGAEPSFDNTYQVVLQGVAAPSAGALLVSGESKPVAGRVVAVTSDGGRHTVTLKLESIRTLFPNLTLDETFDLTRAVATVNPAIAAEYDVERVGNEWRFTPKPGLAKRQNAVPVALFPFQECKSEFSPPGVIPIGLSSKPLLTISQSLGLNLAFSPANGLERFVVTGQVGATVELGTTISLAFEGKLTCETPALIDIVIPIGGPLGVVASGVVPLSAGFEVGGKVTVASATLAAKAGAKLAAELGVACPQSDCSLVHSLTGSAELTPTLKLPSAGDIRFEPSLMLFPKVKLAIGNPFLKKLRFETIALQAGPKLQGSFAAQTSQMLDSAYRSDYKLGLELKAAAGPKLSDALKLLGISKLLSLELVTTVNIGRSPAGTVSADRERWAAGEVVNVKVAFDNTTLDFVPLIGPYNVERVIVSRLRPTAAFAEEVANIAVADRSAEVVIPVQFSDAGTTDELAVFVLTRLLPETPFALEIGRLVVAPVPLKQIAFRGVVPGNSTGGNGAIFVIDGTGGAPRQVSKPSTAAPHMDDSPTWSPDRQLIAFTAVRPFPGIASLMTVRSDGSDERVLFSSASGSVREPSWSPDGRRIAFTRDGEQGVFVVDVSSGAVALLVQANGASSPSWSPDGRRIVFRRVDGGQIVLSIADLVTGVVTNIGTGVSLLTATGSEFRHPAWSPDGSFIAFQGFNSTTRQRTLRLIEVASGVEVEVSVRFACACELRSNGLAWSPDSKEIVVVFATEEVNDNRDFVLGAVGIGGGLIRQISPLGLEAFDPAWAQ